MLSFAYWTSPSAWLVIVLVVVLFFGASRLPQLAKGLGEATREFKKGIDERDAEKK
ncbi:twin-arginine translocase TatA/TatE family subunit [Armatimonas sp.]|uniref:twin-arginine translocase TatA/TatE family subunit n=1 Tax=Armatimonas sp. TaxID=1872638 RepID=UPI00286C1D33|nr:twin-arginine translocase TatA/TatE family subunit [Armatimonas sp.]